MQPPRPRRFLVLGVALSCLLACAEAGDPTVPLLALDSLPVASELAQSTVFGAPNTPPREFALTHTDSVLDLQGWIHLAEGARLGSAAWVRDSVLTVAIAKQPCVPPPGDACVTLAAAVEYRYRVRILSVPDSVRRLEVRHTFPGVREPRGTPFAVEIERRP